MYLLENVIISKMYNFMILLTVCSLTTLFIILFQFIRLFRERTHGGGWRCRLFSDCTAHWSGVEHVLLLNEEARVPCAD